MTIQSHVEAIRGIALAQLVLSPLNVRKVYSESGVAELAELIHTEGVLQNLAGYELPSSAKGRRNKSFAVVAGGRRWRALQLLLSQKRVHSDYIVPFLVTTEARAVAISLVENSGREPLHPADEFEAFRTLIDAGQTVEEVAAHFGVVPLVVQRRLKLANVAPEFIQSYRDGELNLEHLHAFAVTDEHERQRAVWKGLPKHSRSAYSLRQALTESEISSKDPRVKFVTLKAYEKAGGHVRKDLFSEDDNTFVTDLELLDQLVQQKLQRHADSLKSESAAWIETVPRVDYSDRASFGRVKMIDREPSAEEQETLSTLEQELAAVESEAAETQDDGPHLDSLEERRDHLETAIFDLKERCRTPDPAQQARSGILVSIDHVGKVRVERGLLKPDDAKLFAERDKQTARESGQVRDRSHSAALLSRLTAQRTLALRAVFAQDPEVALAAVVHRLVLNTFYDSFSKTSSTLKIEPRRVDLNHFDKDLESTKAHAWITAQSQHLKAMLPEDPRQLFQWVLRQSYVERLALLAFCAAQSLDAVQTHEDASDADELARALKMDLRQWWAPTRGGYLNSVPKAAVLAAVAEGISADAATKLEPLKKGPLAEEAERLLADRGWLPAFLRPAWMPAG